MKFHEHVTSHILNSKVSPYFIRIRKGEDLFVVCIFELKLNFKNS